MMAGAGPVGADKAAWAHWPATATNPTVARSEKQSIQSSKEF